MKHITSKSERNEQEIQARHAMKRLNRVYKNGGSVFEMMDAAEIDVPYFESEPLPEQFGLNQDVIDIREEQIRIKNEALKEYEIIAHKRSIYLAVLIVLSLFVVLFFSELKSGIGAAVTITIVYAFGIIPFGVIIATLTQLAVMSIRKKDKKEERAIDDLISNYDKAVLNYQYWQWKKTTVYWQSLNGYEFENSLAALYRQLGYSIHLTEAVGDKGIDIIVRSNQDEFIVQCKAHKKSIGPAAMRDFYGTMIHNNYEKGVFASVSGFTKGAIEFAQNKNIRLVDVNDIINWDID